MEPTTKSLMEIFQPALSEEEEVPFALTQPSASIHRGSNMSPRSSKPFGNLSPMQGGREETSSTAGEECDTSPTMSPVAQMRGPLPLSPEIIDVDSSSCPGSGEPREMGEGSPYQGSLLEEPRECDGGDSDGRETETPHVDEVSEPIPPGSSEARRSLTFDEAFVMPRTPV